MSIDVAEAWKRIDDTVRFLDPEESRSLPAGASPEDLERVEKEIGVSLPEAFRQAYLLHNGSNQISVCPNAFFLPVVATETSRGILEAWLAMCEIGEEFKDERSKPNGPIRTVHWHPKWVPFADNEGGDYVCLDFAPENGGKVGQVIDWSHEIGPERVLAGSFAEWLVGLPADLKAFRRANQEREIKAAEEARQKFAQAGCWGLPKLPNKTFHFAGKLQQWQLEEAIERVHAEGGDIVDSVTPTLDYLVVGEVKSGRPSDPEKQAIQFNEKGAKIAILEEQEFSKLFSPTREELLAVLWNRPNPERWSWLCGGMYRLVPLPDCSGLSLRNADLSNLDLQSFNLMGADLRDANLRRSALNVCNGKLDGACLVDSMPRHLTNSSLRHADLSEANLNTANLDGADLTGAKLRKCSSPWWSAVGAMFHGADLTECCLEGCKLEGADFSEANLTCADFAGADLTGSNLSRANLEYADLTGAKLVGAILTKAKLFRANLACVDFTNANIDEADFSSANVSGAKTEALNVTKALSFAAEKKQVGKVGPNVQKLIAVARETKDLVIVSESTLEAGKIVLQLHAGAFGANGDQWTQGITGYKDRSWPFPREQATVEDCLVYIAHKWSQATLNLKSIKVKAKGCPVNTKELKKLAIAAYREVFGE
jgi:uncharacterized protein YjbI with pentapeptide repeats/cell wall assembly regulator SMI1